jgi:UDP-N-acetylmuramate--alanine ligase
MYDLQRLRIQTNGRINNEHAQVVLGDKDKEFLTFLGDSLKQLESEKLNKVLKVPGAHNISNALAALAVARILKIPDKISFEALSEYKGAWRRFEVKQSTINNKKITIISDYGHHPTEISVTLKAAREMFSSKEIWCVFQPHQYYRTFYLFKDFVRVHRQAQDKFLVDKVIITDIFDVAGREDRKIKKKVNSEKLVEAIKKSNVIYLPKSKIFNYLKKNLRGGEVVIIMGAGNIYELSKEFSD